MKRNKLTNLAQKIAKAEKLLQSTTDLAEQKKLQLEIIALTNNISNIEDIFIIDDLVQDYLTKQ